MFELEKHICSSFTCEWHPLNSKGASSSDDDIISMAFKNLHKKQTHDSDGYKSCFDFENDLSHMLTACRWRLKDLQYSNGVTRHDG